MSALVSSPVRQILMSDSDRIEIVIEGLPQNAGRVRLSTFMAQLQSLNAAISRIDREFNSGKPGSVFEIVAMSYNSPYRVALQTTPSDTNGHIAHQIFEGFKAVTAAIISGDNLDEFDAELLADIKSLAKPVGKTVKQTTVFLNGDAVEFGPEICSRVDIALATGDECEGALDGMLEQINLHQGANTFHIYPDIGAKKVTCHFPSALYDDAVFALGRRVQVFGLLRYRVGAPFPHQITVSSIDVFPNQDELPSWDDLRGRAPDATGALSSEAFIRELRDAW